MIFDTLKKKKQAEQAQQDWAANRPADYESTNTAAMDDVAGQIGTGFDWDTADAAYQQYRNQSAANASDAAANAVANASALSGGYGSSYADSVARQGQQQALAAIDNAVPNLRSTAQTEYQNRQSNLLAALSGLANTEALDRSAYGANLANYESKASALANESSQARNENDNFWNNLWNSLQYAGNVAMTAYDGYKGYTYQQEQLDMQKRQLENAEKQQAWENQMSEDQWNYNKTRTDKSDQAGAYQTGASLYGEGYGDAAKGVASLYNIDPEVFSSYTGAPITREDQASILTTAAQLVANGNQEAADNLLAIYGIDKGTAGNYNTVAQRAFAEYAQKQAYQKSLSGSGSTSRKSTGSGSSGDSWTNSQLRQMASDYNKMADSNELKPYYRQVLTEHGWITEDGKTSQETGNSGNTATTSADRLVQGYSKKGYSAWAITNLMSNQGYSDAEIAAALEKAGVE